MTIKRRGGWNFVNGRISKKSKIPPSPPQIPFTDIRTQDTIIIACRYSQLGYWDDQSVNKNGTNRGRNYDLDLSILVFRARSPSSSPSPGKHFSLSVNPTVELTRELGYCYSCLAE